MFSKFRVLYSRLKSRRRVRLKHLVEARNMSKNCDDGHLNDYKKALYKHKFTYEEYMYRYKLWSLPKHLREDVISCAEMDTIYYKFVTDEIRKVFADKYHCLNIFSKWIHRRFLRAKDTSYDDFLELVSFTDCIIKPINGECGKGIFKTNKNNIQNIKELYARCVENDMLIEQFIRACDEIESFHPASLNTIRVVTMSNGLKCVFIGAALRMGAEGNVIDNVSAGGLSVPIDMDTGIIQMNGYDAKGVEYERHPTTGKAFKGTQIPYWENVRTMCIEASKIVSGARFIGWDICILPSGEIELIEANAMPDIGVIQFTPGYEKRKVIQMAGKELFHTDLMKLTSIWDFTYRNI